MFIKKEAPKRNIKSSKGYKVVIGEKQVHVRFYYFSTITNTAPYAGTLTFIPWEV